MELIRMDQINKVFGSGPTAVHALKNISVTINQGEFVAIVGTSGSGKSTLLNLLGTLDKPTSGMIYLENKPLFSLSPDELAILRRRKFGFIFQYYNLIPVLTAQENIELPLLLDGKAIDKPFIEELIQWLGLAERRNHLPDALSGGQQQRVAIARALACKPSIIFADEPTGNLDKNTSNEVLNLLRLSIKKYHQTLIMITHDHFISERADRVLTIEDGIIIRDKSVKS